MKKKYSSLDFSKIHKEFNDNKKNLEVKTTNVNVLLNRVKLEKKKTLNKRILFSFTLIALTSLLAIFLITQS